MTWVFCGAVFLALVGVALWVAWPRPIDAQRECGADWGKEGER